MHNTSHWCERTVADRVHLDYNTVGLSFETDDSDFPSFGYCRWLNLFINGDPGQIGIRSTGNTSPYNNVLVAVVNMVGAGTLMSVEDTSLWLGTSGAITGEGHTPYGGAGIVVEASAAFNGPIAVSTYDLPHSYAGGGSAYSRMRPGTVAVEGGTNDPQIADGGIIADFISTDDATVYPVVLSSRQVSQSSFGFLKGSNIESPFVSLYDYNGNALVILAQPFEDPIDEAVEVFRVTNKGQLVAERAEVPSAAMLSSAGGSPPAAVVSAWSNSSRGRIRFGTGSAPATGGVVQVSFATGYPVTNPTVMLTPTDSLSSGVSPTAALGLYVYNVSATGFWVGCAVAPTASQANTVYGFDYLVLG